MRWVDDVVDDPELAGPPPIHCPTAPLKLAMVPFVGATSVAAARLFCAVCSGDCALATCAVAAVEIRLRRRRQRLRRGRHLRLQRRLVLRHGVLRRLQRARLAAWPCSAGWSATWPAPPATGRPRSAPTARCPGSWSGRCAALFCAVRLLFERLIDVRPRPTAAAAGSGSAPTPAPPAPC